MLKKIVVAIMTKCVRRELLLLICWNIYNHTGGSLFNEHVKLCKSIFLVLLGLSDLIKPKEDTHEKKHIQLI